MATEKKLKRVLAFCPESGHVCEHYLMVRPDGSEELVCPLDGLAGGGIPVKEEGKFEAYCLQCQKLTEHSHGEVPNEPVAKKRWCCECGSTWSYFPAEKYKALAKKYNSKCAVCGSDGKEEGNWLEIVHLYGDEYENVYHDENYLTVDNLRLICHNCLTKEKEKNDRKKRVKTFKKTLKPLSLKLGVALLLCSIGFLLFIPGLVFLFSWNPDLVIGGVLMVLLGVFLYIRGLKRI